jgi:hypothetical protein
LTLPFSELYQFQENRHVITTPLCLAASSFNFFTSRFKLFSKDSRKIRRDQRAKAAMTLKQEQSKSLEFVAQQPKRLEQEEQSLRGRGWAPRPHDGDKQGRKA